MGKDLEDLTVEDIESIYNTLCRHKSIVANIDTDFYIYSTKALLDKIEELESIDLPAPDRNEV